MARDNVLVARVATDLERFAHGSDLDHCPELAALFDPRSPAALAFVSTFTGIGMAALADSEGGGISPMTERVVDGEAQILLLAEGAARILLVVHRAPGVPADTKANPVTFRPMECWRHVLAGSAQAQVLRCAEPGSARTRIEAAPLAMQAGLVRHEMALHEAVSVCGIATDLVELRLERAFAASFPACRYDRLTGMRLDDGDGGLGETRRMAAAAALGGMGRRDAVSPLVAIAGSEDAPELRRHALEILWHLDERTGRALCERIARNAHDPLHEDVSRRVGRRREGLARRMVRISAAGLPWFG